jgi:hypothetical protein
LAKQASLLLTWRVPVLEPLWMALHLCIGQGVHIIGYGTHVQLHHIHLRLEV